MKIYANIDGGSRGNPGPAASAYVLADEKGNIIEEKGVYLGEATNNRAEYYALHIALEAAVQRGVAEIEVRSDSLLLVNQFNGKFKIKDSGLFQMMGEIKAVSAKLSKVKLSHIPREKNKLADAAVNKTLDAIAKGVKPQFAAPVLPSKKADGGEQLKLF